MSRKETSNTWSDGLVMDLNPMNTPNTVLTDNLNGTLITYNGNEHLLQNDQGNFKLKHCKLSPNFVPVGLKEYADILYIVSYNPITEETEIGSYPSPRIINTSVQNGDQDSNRQYAITSAIANNGNTLVFYDIDEYNYNLIFAGKDMKLNPGDMFQLVRQLYDPLPLYEGIEYQIIDDDKRLHDVTKSIEEYLERYSSGSEFQNVLWDVPGWLSVKSRIAELSSFSMGITKFDSKDGSLTIGYRFQFNIDDPILISRYKEGTRSEEEKRQFYIEDIEISLKERIAGKENVETILSVRNLNSTWTVKEWYDNNIIVQVEYEHTVPLEDGDTNRTVTLTATPFLIDPYDVYSIEYKHLEETIDATFDNFVTVGNKDLSFGTNIYRFSRNEGFVTVDFDVLMTTSGDVPVIPDDLMVYGKFFTLDGNCVTDGAQFIEMAGDLILSDSSSESDEDVNTMSISNLQDEMIYKAIFVVSTENPNDSSLTFDKTIDTLNASNIGYSSKILITSLIFNEYMGNSDLKNFEDIPMNTWVSDYISKYLIGGELEVSNIQYEEVRDEDGRIWNEDSTYWNQGGLIKNESKKNESITLTQEYDVTFDFTNTQEELLKKYRIGMWSSLIKDPVYYLSGLYNHYGNEVSDFMVIPENSDSENSDSENSESLGDWDVNTANVNKNTISYTNYTYWKNDIEFEYIDTYPNYPLINNIIDSEDLSAAPNIKNRILTISYRNLDSYMWQLYLTNESISENHGAGRLIGEYSGDENYIEYDFNDVLKEDADIFLIKAYVKIEGSGDDYKRFGHDKKDDTDKSDADQFLTNDNHKQDFMSNAVWLIAIKSSDKVAFYNASVDSFSQLENIFANCVLISGSEVGDYKAFRPYWASSESLRKELGGTLSSKLTYEKEWYVNQVDLFSLNELSVITWENTDLPESSIDTTFSEECDWNYESNKQFIQNYINEVTENLKKVDEISTKYYDANNGYLGLRGGTNDSVLNYIKNNTEISDSKFQWTGSSDERLIVGSSKNSKQLNFGLGYYFE